MIYRIGWLFNNGGGAVIVGDNMERKSMSYYHKWALFNNNEGTLSNIRSAITYCDTLL